MKRPFCSFGSVASRLRKVPNWKPSVRNMTGSEIRNARISVVANLPTAQEPWCRLRGLTTRYERCKDMRTYRYTAIRLCRNTATLL